MHISLQNIAFGVALLITGTSATVSLSSFTPRIDNIPNSQCESAYTTSIKGCQASDFGAGARCSSSCVQGLQEMTGLVQSACRGVDVGSNSIIGVFQNGIGIRSLCPGVDVVASSSSAAAAISSRTTVAQTSTQAATSRTSTPSSASPAPSSTTTTGTTTLNTQSSAAAPAQSSASSSRGLIVDPNPTSISGVQPPASSTAARPQQPERSNQDSGGGSPFDVQATGESSRRAVDIMLASFVGTALLFAACA